LAEPTPGLASALSPGPGEEVVIRLVDHGAVANDDEDDSEAFRRAYAAAEAAARRHGAAVLELGAGTYDLTPAPPPHNHLYQPRVDGVTIRGEGMDATRLRLWAAPAGKGGPRRHPAELINHRGAFCRIDDVHRLAWEGFTLDGQAPPTHRMNDWWTAEARRDGWDITHKGWLWTGTATAQRIRDVRATNFRGEIFYAGGGNEEREILIEDSVGEGSNGSLFSFSATLTLRRCQFRNFGQGVENYAFARHHTLIEDCEIDASGWLYHGHDSTRKELRKDGRYRIVENTGGLDVTNLGAPDNEPGTEFVANANAAPRDWGEGVLERHHRSSGIVIFNQRGSRVRIVDTTVRNANRAILITDFAHHWTIEGLRLIDCRFGIYRSGLRTSSSPADHAAHAGADRFVIRDFSVLAERENLQAAFSLFPGGANTASDWQLSDLRFEERGGRVLKLFELGSGCRPPFSVRGADLRGIRPSGNVASSSYRPRLLDCQLSEWSWDGGMRGDAVFVPPHEGPFRFRYAHDRVITVDPASGPALPDGFTVQIRGAGGKAFTLRWIEGWRGKEPIFAESDRKGEAPLTLVFHAETQSWEADPPELPPGSWLHHYIPE
jgi:hypothetical protein